MESVDNMDKFELKEIKKIRPIKNMICYDTYDRLINYIFETKKKCRWFQR